MNSAEEISWMECFRLEVVFKTEQLEIFVADGLKEDSNQWDRKKGEYKYECK